MEGLFLILPGEGIDYYVRVEIVSQEGLFGLTGEQGKC